MANLTPTPVWGDVFQLEKETPVLGGAGGVANRQAQELVNRTQYLYEKYAALRLHFQEKALNLGMSLVDGSFEDGATITASTQLLLQESTAKVYAWGGTLPKTVAAGALPVEPEWIDKTGKSLREDLATETGSGLVYQGDESIGTIISRNIVEAKLLPGSENGAANKAILEAKLATGFHVVVNGPAFTINGPIDITESNGVTFSGLGVCTLTKGNDQPLFRLYSNHAYVEGFDCAGYVAGTETTDTIIIGENDGANGQNVANGYKPAIRARVKDVTIIKSGRDGISWREGAFLDLDNVHVLDPARHALFIDPKGFDNSHGTGTVASAGAGDHGFYIGWGNHNFTLLKSFSDAKGVYINQSRGAQYNLFVELSGTAAVELGPDTLANDVILQFWTIGKNYVDNGIGNRITGMALGNNSGAITESFTRTNKLLVNRAFTANGTSPLAGGLLIEQLSNNDFSIGDNAYTCKLIATPAGLALRDVACHSKVFDLSGFGSTQNLSNDNQHIDTFLLANGQTLQINGASGTGYIPFDGQTITVRLKGAGSVGINGQIAGSLHTVNITTTNGFKRFKHISAQGFWFEE